jgi:16S rRNA processing protein RimM
MAADRGTLLEVGKIVKAHGIKGDVLVLLSSDRVERLNPGSVLSTSRGDVTVTRSAIHQGAYIVKFAEIADRTAAEGWRNTVLSAEKLVDDEEDDDVIWIDELFDAQVVSEDGQVFGTVVSVEENPASDIMVLDNGFLVPLAFVVEVVANERIVIDPPEGLFDE